jgi:hypothetical protein
MSRVPASSLKHVSATTVDDSPSEMDVESDDRRNQASASAERQETARALVWDLVDEWGAQSFPASDPPANW